MHAPGEQRGVPAAVTALAARLRTGRRAISATAEMPAGRWNDFLLAWLGLVFLVTLATIPLVGDETRHYRTYYLLGAAPLLLLVLPRPAYWRELLRSPPFAGFGLLVLYLTLHGLLVGDVGWEARYDTLRYGLLALSFVFGVVVVSRRYPSFPGLLVGGLVLAGGLSGGLYALEHLLEWGGSGRLPALRFSDGYIDNPNRIAAVYAPLALMGLVLAFRGSSARLETALWLGLATGSLAAVLLTQSRGGLLGMAVAAGLFLAMERHWRTLTITLGGLLLFVLAVEVDLLPIREFTERIGSIEKRLGIWQSTLARIGQAPLWGEGWATSHSVYVEAYGRSWIHPHNTLLTVALQAGLAGALLYLVVVGKWLWDGCRLWRRHWSAAVGVTVLAYWLVHSLVENRLGLGGVNREWIYLLLPVALLAEAALRSGALSGSREEGAS